MVDPLGLPSVDVRLTSADETYGVVAAARVILTVSEVEGLYVREAAPDLWSEAELAYARSKSDPQRRLTARLAARRAAQALLGDDLGPADLGIAKTPGSPPSLELSSKARTRLAALGATRALVSLTHERDRAAAAVVLLSA